MPSWLVNFVLPYVIPVIVQGISPVLTEYVKVAVAYLKGHLPASAVVVLAASVAEGINQAQAALSGVSLPPGVGALISIALNELGADFGAQPPTPGVTPTK